MARAATKGVGTGNPPNIPRSLRTRLVASGSNETTPAIYGTELLQSAGAGTSTPDVAAFDITGDITLAAINARQKVWATGFNLAMVSKFNSTGNQRSYVLGVEATGKVRFLWSADGTNTLTADSTVVLPVENSGRISFAASIDVDDGGGNRVITFRTSTNSGGSWSTLGTPVTTAGTTSIFASTAAVCVGALAGGSAFTAWSGRLDAAEIRSGGIAGTLVGNPIFSGQPLGTTSFADAQGRTWTLGSGSQIVAKSSIHAF